jgi:drug/metabolite transporter (DMT)-like permease
MLDAMSRGNPGQEPAKAAGMGRAPRVGSQTASFGPPDRWLAVGAVAGQTAIAAGTFLIAKQTLVTIPPLALAMMRMAGAALFLGVVLAFRARGARPIPRSSWPEIILLGVIGVTINQTAFLAGLKHSTPTHAALLYALTPACVQLLTLLAGEETLSRRRAAGIVLALAGAAAIISVRAPGQAVADTRHGDLLIAIGVVAWAIYSARAPRHVRAIGAIRFTGATLIAGALAALPFGVVPVLALDLGRIPTAAWLGLGFLIVFTSGLAYALWTVAMKGLTATQVAVFVNFQPVLTALLSIWLLGEALTPALLLGGGLVCLGVMLTQSEARPLARETHGT